MIGIFFPVDRRYMGRISIISGAPPLGGTMSKREPQIILKTASEAFASS